VYSCLVLAPFLGVIILNLPFRAIMRKAAFWLCLLILSAQICLALFPAALSRLCGINALGSFLQFDFTADSLTRLLLLCIGIVLFAVLFVQRYIAKEEARFFNFVSMLLLTLAGMNGAVMVRDIFSLYVFLEITAVGSFILIAFNDDADSFEGSFKYMVLSMVATVLMLASIALLLVVSGDTSFSALRSAIQSSPNKVLIDIALAIFLCACFIKAGLMPFHGWLPDVYSSAPASVSVLLAGIVTKTVGVYTLMRIVGSVFGFGGPIKNILLVVGALSVVLAAFAALGQNNFKRMLAYSSISQVGYIILGLGCGTALGAAGAMFHLFNHAMFKSLLFVNSAAVEHETGTRDMGKLSGLAQRMPLTGVTSILASLSAAGVPPLAGFWSKLLIIIALWMAGLHSYAVIAVLASILTLAYLLTMQRSVFFGELKGDLARVKESGFCMALPAVILAAITVGVGIAFPFVINIFISSVSGV